MNQDPLLLGILTIQYVKKIKGKGNPNSKITIQFNSRASNPIQLTPFRKN